MYSGSREPGCSVADKCSLVVQRPKIRFTGIQCVHRHQIRIDSNRSVAATVLMSAMQTLIITRKMITVDVIGCGDVVLIHLG